MKGSKAWAWLWAILLVLGGGCQPPDVPGPVEPDGGSDDVGPGVEVCMDSPASCACSNLCRLDCDECAVTCETSIEKIVADRIMVFDTDCVIGAASKQAVRSCPGIKCP